MNLGPSVASPSGMTYRAIDTDLALTELFGGEIGEILGSEHDIRRYKGSGEFYYLIQGYIRSRGQGPIWTSKDTLRAHLDIRLLSEFQDRSSEEFLHEIGLRCCRICGRNISQRYISGFHSSCWPRMRDPIRDKISLSLNEIQYLSLSEIFIAPPIFTKDQFL